MDFIRKPNFYGSDEDGFEGRYYYDKYGEPIELWGSLDSLGNIVMTEINPSGESSGSFKGNIDGKGIFSGTWTSGDGERSFPFKLSPDGDNALISFQAYSFMDSLVIGFNDKPGDDSERESAAIHIQQWWLYPSVPNNPELESFIRKEIRQMMVGDSLAALFTNPQEAFDAAKQPYFDDFGAEVKEMIEYDQESGEGLGWINDYSFDESMGVHYNSDSILTLGFHYYSYTGGAHGNYGVALRTYDLQKRKLLKLSDVFKAGYEKALSDQLANVLRKDYELEPGDPLSYVLFEDTIAPTENFGLTDKGILFSYDPYEVAAYAVGQIELFIPFEALGEWLY